ncbi:MAG TPA: HAMP domain-containing sensor histidine kinase [Magnetospirillum sp.]|nr:HAMP domain-containing sensor histidine kinase [Magnetospirillum sp.]
MNTRTLKWLALGLFLTFSAFAGGLAVSRVDHFAKTNDSLREQPFQLADGLLRAHHHVHKLQAGLRDAILANDVNAALAVQGRSTFDDKGLTEALDLVVNGQWDDEELVGRIVTAMSAWRDTRLRTAQLVVDGRQYDASFLHNSEGEDRYRHLEAVLEESLEAGRHHAARLRVEANRARRSAEFSLLGLAVLASGAITAIAVGLAVLMRTHRPLLRLRSGLLSLAAGDTGIAIPYLLNTNAIGAMARAIDCFRQSLTERDAATRALRESKERLRQAVDEAEQANAAKSRFLAAASHDMRQPMQALRLYLETLETRLTEGLDRRVLNGALTALAAGEELLRNYMDLSVLEAGIIKPHSAELALGPLLADLVREIAPVAREKGLDLRFVPTHAVIRSDAALLDRLLRNLLSNAIRYTPMGRVLVGCRREGEGLLRIEVADTGIGIPPDQIEAVFEDFYQIGNPERDRAKGLGLGLSVVDRTARLLGHPVHVRSIEGRGSIFWVVVPLAGWQDKSADALVAA